MNKTPRTLLALALAAATSQAFALGLGPIAVKSQIDEPLVAEIPVIGASPDEAAGLTARVGSSRELEAGGLDAASGSAPVELQVVEGRDGRPVIRVTTKRAVRDPLVSFVVNVSWPSGRLVREYSVAIPSAGGAQGTMAQSAPEPERAPRVEPSAAPKPPAKPVAAKPVAVDPVAKPVPSASAPVAAKPAEPKSAPPPKPVVTEAKPAPAPVKSVPPPAPAKAQPVAAEPVATPAKPAPPPAPAKPVAAETQPVATAAPPPAVPASDKPAAARTELERAKAELAAKESDTSALKARVEELERSQPTNRERLDEENRKLAEAERQLNDLAREATAQQQALAQLQAQPQAQAPPGADAGAASSAPAGDAGGSGAPATAEASAGTEPAPVAPLPETDAAVEPSPPPRPERSLLDQWLLPGALALVALLGALFVFSRMRRPSPAVAAPVLAGAEVEPEFDLSEPDGETPIELADEPAQPIRTASEDEAQFEMLRLFYLRGDTAGFEDTARFVREQNPNPDLWRRVAEMGRMLAPENPLYADAAARHMEFDFSDLQPPQPAEAMVEQDSDLSDTLFELEPEPDVAAPPAERADSELEPFEFDQPLSPQPPMDEVATVAMPALAPLPELPPLDESDQSVAEFEPEPEPAPVAADSASHAGGPQDPVDTKLELAQAYLEMGDAEGAQHMLDEVMNEGDSRQKAEALRLREQAGPAQRRA